MKLHELIKVISRDQEEIVLYLLNDNYAKRIYKDIGCVPIIFANYEVVEVYGYDASGYDGIIITIVEE